jgi:hypothetical protein
MLDNIERKVVVETILKLEALDYMGLNMLQCILGTVVKERLMTVPHYKVKWADL